MLKDRNVYAIISAAGSGRRMAAPVPKQFIQIDGKTILEKTVEPFLNCSLIDGIVIVVPETYLDFSCRIFSAPIEKKKLRVIKGGKERQDSVHLGLTALREIGAEDDSIVLIHDGVRPYVSENLIRTVAETAAKAGAVVPAVPPKDTIRHREKGTLDRSMLCCVQTPQGFELSLIEEACRQALSRGFYGTDDGGLVERMGRTVAIVEGETTNIKITTPEDLMTETRIGTGFDVHRLTENRKLILGGVEIPFERGLDGHSDADVLIHALMDALLGAAACGDIGRLFPDTDPAYEGISSLLLLEKTGQVLKQEGYSIGNADMTVICQRPKLAPHIEQMRINIAQALEVPEDKISIKATTTEKLGFTGRGEGIAAEAVCLLHR